MSENLSLLKQLDFQGDHYNDLLFEVNTIFFLWEAMNEKTATKNYTFPHFVVIFCVQLVCVGGGFTTEICKTLLILEHILPRT